MTENFNPTKIPPEKEEPLRRELAELESEIAKRMDDYEFKRADAHWENDNSYHHIEKALGELAVAYTVAKYNGDEDELRQECADALNHMLMALDIGPEDLPIDEKGIRLDKK